MASEEELGLSLNECPEENQRLTMYVDGVQVWGVEPENAPAMESDSSKPIYGDVDCNSVVDISDAVLLARYVVGDEVIVTDAGLENADTKRDNELNEKDVLCIVKYVAGFLNITDLGK